MMVELDEASTEKPTVRDTCQVLMIRVGGVLACIELSNVERTFSLVALQTMPSSAPYVAGIMNFAGSSLPVIDLAIRLGLPSSPYTLDTPIVVCVHEQQRIGVIVQDIAGIQILHERDQQLIREFSRHGAAFRASAHTGMGLALLLDAAWLIQPELYHGTQARGD